ncbi:hypothetical protein ACFPRL_18480 [Pseudoclavibacter helvolus]|uniref:Uncharacterized protein n=1 Tax=Pseudoclavibacter helvolus TaxID=255205 RepID=A0A7W4UPY4_9MICO|nr:hypothetical protein [Pseudoclavibacter helvolus]MBB2958034.1 hypothetical protein [Pseudoclavibacter helvolus]
MSARAYRSRLIATTAEATRASATNLASSALSVAVFAAATVAATRPSSNFDNLAMGGGIGMLLGIVLGAAYQANRQ